MLEPYQALLLALVQALTEWFPISSSAHLLIVQHLLGIKASVGFNVMLHLGSLIPLFHFLRRDIVRLLRFGKGSKEVVSYIVVGSLPLALFGFFFKSFFESLFLNLTVVSLALIVNGTIIYLTKFSRARRNIKLLDSTLIGLAQVLALIPGISRSGITISTALIRSVKKKEAYKFSFLLSMVAILGASSLKLGEIDFSQEPPLIIFLGMITTSLISYFSLKILTKFVLEGSFHNFAYYCWFLGTLVLILSLCA